ncbi:MAG: lipocalin family protein [bacterium]|nr:lipocalin family protein [bacterium]
MQAARFSTLALLVALLAALLPAAAAAERPSRAPHRPRVVERVDLPRYCGTWHEIAHIPNRFQKDCGCCATATYALRADGKLSVTNRCRKADGTLDEFTAEAEVVDTRTNARLKLTPFKILGLAPVKADYWILGLEPDYRWAVVGGPDRKYGWILAREPRLTPAQRAEIDALLERQGYDPAAFSAGEQPWTPATQEAAP